MSDLGQVRADSQKEINNFARSGAHLLRKQQPGIFRAGLPTKIHSDVRGFVIYALLVQE